jgi:hypothetical protein
MKTTNIIIAVLIIALIGIIIYAFTKKGKEEKGQPIIPDTNPNRYTISTNDPTMLEDSSGHIVAIGTKTTTQAQGDGIWYFKAPDSNPTGEKVWVFVRNGAV